IDGCADGGWRPDELPADLVPHAALHVSGSLALPVATMGDTIETLLMRERPRRVITFDPNIRPSLARDEQAVRARLERWLGLAHAQRVAALTCTRVGADPPWRHELLNHPANPPDDQPKPAETGPTG